MAGKESEEVQQGSSQHNLLEASHFS